MTEVEAAMRQLAQQHSGRATSFNYGPVEEEAIIGVERAFNLLLPRSYRDYLATFAGGMLFGYDVCGIPTAKSQIPTFADDPADIKPGNLIQDVVVVNQDYIRIMPAGLVYITGDGGDDSFFLDTNRMMAEECPVLMFGPGANGMRVANNFLDFVRQIATGASFRFD